MVVMMVMMVVVVWLGDNSCGSVDGDGVVV